MAQIIPSPTIKPAWSRKGPGVQPIFWANCGLDPGPLDKLEPVTSAEGAEQPLWCGCIPSVHV